MQFRFVERQEDDSLKLIALAADIKDYAEMFKFLTFAKDNECVCSITTLVDDIVDTDGDAYMVKHVSFVPTTLGGETTPHFAVEIVEDYY